MKFLALALVTMVMANSTFAGELAGTFAHPLSDLYRKQERARAEADARKRAEALAAAERARREDEAAIAAYGADPVSRIQQEILYFLLAEGNPQIASDQVVERQLEYSQVDRADLKIKPEAKSRCAGQSIPTLQVEGYILTKSGIVYKVRVYPKQVLEKKPYWTLKDGLTQPNGVWVYTPENRYDRSNYRFLEMSGKDPIKALFPAAVYRKFENEIWQTMDYFQGNTKVVGWPLWGIYDDSSFDLCSVFYRFEVEP